MGTPHRTLRVRFRDAERPGLHSHAERGNDQCRVTGRGPTGSDGRQDDAPAASGTCARFP
ncbi:hypothetical protein PSUM_03840 [Pseudomonas umsongensis]|uniref:Uncharacterized protein n=1 Tax=Pseudomonas umsongensis TaxID=198618 RepID=A0ABX4E078_9PSED|nr:hypothetical protein PSUM_03840 [Pseudomonas umsongensis]